MSSLVPITQVVPGATVVVVDVDDTDCAATADDTVGAVDQPENQCPSRDIDPSAATVVVSSVRIVSATGGDVPPLAL